MATRGGPVHVVTTSRSYKGRTYRTHLLRRSYREDGKVRNETLGNLSHLPDELIDVIRRSLKGERFVSAEDSFHVVVSKAHGHVLAVQTAMQRLGFAKLIDATPSRQRDLICAMVAARIVAPQTKLATTRCWTACRALQVASSSNCRLRARRSASAGLRQATSRSPGKSG